MKRCAEAVLVGLDEELPTDPNMAYTGKPPIVGCNHIVCVNCGAVVRHADSRSTTRNDAPPREELEELYESDDPGSSPLLDGTPLHRESRTYFCRCDWYAVNLGGTAFTRDPRFGSATARGSSSRSRRRQHALGRVVATLDPTKEPPIYAFLDWASEEQDLRRFELVLESWHAKPLAWANSAADKKPNGWRRTIRSSQWPRLSRRHHLKARRLMSAIFDTSIPLPLDDIAKLGGAASIS